MEKIFILAFLVSIIYGALCVLDMKYVQKEWKPLKDLVRDVLIVFISGGVAGFITFYADNHVSDFLNIVTQTKVLDSASSQVFTGEPGF
jgi:TctA family transporter